MIDMHNHILVNVDDGPRDLDSVLALLKQAKNEGVTGIVATPHHLHPQYDNQIMNVKESLEALRELEEVKALDLNFYSGQEIRITDQIIDEINSGSIEGINGSRYLLIELPSNEVPHYTQQLFYELQSMEYIPIIAHPERNKIITQDLNVLFNLINGGALAQITSSSLRGDFGKKIRKVSMQMIENKLVHFISSDAHSVNERPFVMKELLHDKKLKKHKNDINDLIGNANSLIENKSIYKQRPTQDYSQKKWFEFK